MSEGASSELKFDPEIERTFRKKNQSNKKRRERQRQMANQNNQNLAQQLANVANDPIIMANNSTLPMRSYASPNFFNFSPGILYTAPDGSRFEMKSVMLQMLATAGQFGGTRRENPHDHLKRFLETCNSFVIPGIAPEAIRLTLFPYSLKDDAKIWASKLAPGEITTWDKLVEKFIQRYFPSNINVQRRREILNFEQGDSETLSDAWERFKELVKDCPNHGLPCTVQMEHFYGGLNKASRMAADAAAAGGIMDKSYTEAKEIMDRIAKHNVEWGDDMESSRSDRRQKRSGQIETDMVTALSAQVAAMSNMLKNMVMPNASRLQGNQVNALSQPMVDCVGCGHQHSLDACPQTSHSVYSVQNDPFSNTYNPGWRNHPNFSWGGQSQQQDQRKGHQGSGIVPGLQQMHPSRGDYASSSTSLETLLKGYIAQNDATMRTQATSIRNLEVQLGQLANDLKTRSNETSSNYAETSRNENRAAGEA